MSEAKPKTPEKKPETQDEKGKVKPKTDGPASGSMSVSDSGMIPLRTALQQMNSSFNNTFGLSESDLHDAKEEGTPPAKPAAEKGKDDTKKPEV